VQVRKRKSKVQGLQACWGSGRQQFRGSKRRRPAAPRRQSGFECVI